MIDAKIAPELWKQIVEAVTSVMTEINLKFKPDGLSITQMSTDKSTMVGVFVPASDFLSYGCTKERLVILNAEQPSNIVKRMSGTTEVSLSNDEDGPDGNILTVTLIGENNRRSFNLPMLVPESDKRELVIPNDIEYESDFQLSGSILDTVVKDMSLVAARARFFVDERRITVKGRGDSGAEAKSVFELGKELTSIDKRIDPNEPLAASFGLGPLGELVKAFVDKKEQVLVRMSNNKPLWIEMQLGNGGQVILILSPVIERGVNT